MIDGSGSSQIDRDIYTFSERAPFTLLGMTQPDGMVAREHFEIKVYFDESVLEVFANDRCMFATRIYPATQ